MLKPPTAGGAPRGRPPWLPTSSGIFSLCLTLLLGQVGWLWGHPQCLDFGPPFRPPQHLEFCSNYQAFGCCDQRQDQRLAARFRAIVDHLDQGGHRLCGGYIKDILCQVSGGQQSWKKNQSLAVESAGWGAWVPSAFEERSPTCFCLGYCLGDCSCFPPAPQSACSGVLLSLRLPRLRSWESSGSMWRGDLSFPGVLCGRVCGEGGG